VRSNCKDEMRGSLHCATDDETVRRFSVEMTMVVLADWLERFRRWRLFRFFGCSVVQCRHCRRRWSMRRGRARGSTASPAYCFSTTTAVP
ncbi:MAG: hypothetical protein ACRD3K_04085, partial [Edaphobacter sp.]